MWITYFVHYILLKHNMQSLEFNLEFHVFILNSPLQLSTAILLQPTVVHISLKSEYTTYAPHNTAFENYLSGKTPIFFEHSTIE
jgi:hypothetical protein